MSSTRTANNKWLFLFDFDHTLVEANTDLQPVHLLAPDLQATHINNREMRRAGWTSLMNQVLLELHTRGKSPENILNAVAESPMPLPTVQLITMLANSPHVHTAIISDANSLYINACLHRNKLSPDHFDAGIFTNPASIHNQCIRVQPYARFPHSCPYCPTNLCKTVVLEELAHSYQPSTLIYVGDGSNDLCPAKHVPANGFVLARSGFALEHAISGEQSEHALQANVRIWKNAQHLKQLVHQILNCV